MQLRGGRRVSESVIVLPERFMNKYLELKRKFLELFGDYAREVQNYMAKNNFEAIQMILFMYRIASEFSETLLKSIREWELNFLVKAGKKYGVKKLEE